MKKVLRNFIILLILSCTALLLNAKHNYDKTGYSIENLNVEVNVNDRKEYDVTEVIDTDFRLEKHGITRVIGSGITNGDFDVKNISVEGAPFTVNKGKDNFEVKIGDNEQEVIGEKDIL